MLTRTLVQIVDRFKVFFTEANELDDDAMTNLVTGYTCMWIDPYLQILPQPLLPLTFRYHGGPSLVSPADEHLPHRELVLLRDLDDDRVREEWRVREAQRAVRREMDAFLPAVLHQLVLGQIRMQLHL